ncbi:hypothetical protein E0Z10_g1575 [Xylaria hypoxylon]|uniref:AB hydrolase-1 domain-containing protein n=1 Tax=Xylaria hypoxylon TaxID=37992 RepID=A0A4Z0Z6B0_9PEZI|nr:hypothetical protein E0Z10_g1575 [Xylaria hypoxylon]
MSCNHLSYPSRSNGISINNDSQHVLIFFVPGNPGLVGYYAPFLSSLRDSLDSNTSLTTTYFHIHGQNLAGFTDQDHEPFTSQRKPYDLEYQIQHILKTVSGQRIESGPKQGQSYDHVLLIGHSVGAYIVLETCHRVLRDPSLAPELKLTSGILLFPTIVHIADSPSGWRLNTLRQTPLLGDNAYRIAQGFLHLWSYNTLHWFVSRILGFPPHAVDVTTQWLKSRDGVWQSLHLGMDEMRVIGEDKWDDELWDISQSSKSAIPKFYFFFGQRDHWVAEHYRDAFIRKRSAQTERTRLIVDEGDLPHAFCIDHSEPVAQKVHAWITEMFGAPK